jgi:hypothetical protein
VTFTSSEPKFAPELYEPHYRLGVVLGKLGRLPEAEQQLRLAIQHHSEYYEAHLALEELLAGNNKTAEAF